MQTVLLKVSDKKRLTANDAVEKNETRAFCPECKKPVRLHRRGKRGKPVAHFEHLSRTGRCPLHYRR